MIDIVKYKINFSSLVKKYWKPVLIITLLYFAGIFSIIRANFDYIDDMARISEGYRNWWCFSRYTSDFLAALIHTSTYLTDISPLPQFIACFVMAISSVIVLYAFENNDNFSFTIWKAFAVIPFAINPYFLECLSYKFDAPYMALSVFGSVLPIFFYLKNPILYAITIFLGTLLMCTTYQAASGIFPVLVIVFTLKLWNDGVSFKKLVKKIGISAVTYVLTLLFFKVFLVSSWEDYVETATPKLNQLLPTFFSNVYSYYQYVISDFKKSWLLVILAILISYIIVFTILSKQNKFLAFFISVFSVAFCLLISFGAYSIFLNPLFAPRAMYGFTTFIAILCIYLSVVISNNCRLSVVNIPIICLSWVFFVFSFSYGNALAHQKEYSDFRIESVINSLNSLDEFNQDSCVVQISGTAGYCPSIAKGSKEYNVLKRLVPLTFTEYWYHGNYKFYNYYGINVARNDYIDMIPLNYPTLIDTKLHTIKGCGNNFLVILK